MENNINNTNVEDIESKTGREISSNRENETILKYCSVVSTEKIENEQKIRDILSQHKVCVLHSLGEKSTVKQEAIARQFELEINREFYGKQQITDYFESGNSQRENCNLIIAKDSGEVEKYGSLDSVMHVSEVYVYLAKEDILYHCEPISGILDSPMNDIWLEVIRDSISELEDQLNQFEQSYMEIKDDPSQISECNEIINRMEDFSEEICNAIQALEVDNG